MRKFVQSSKLDKDEMEIPTCRQQKSKFSTIVALTSLWEAPKIDIAQLNFEAEIPKSPCNLMSLSQSDIVCIKEMFFASLGTLIESISPIAKSAMRLALGNQIVSANTYRGSSAYSFVFARWNLGVHGFEYRPAVVEKIVNVCVTDKTIDKTFWLAKVKWFRQHDRKDFYGQNSQTKIWSTLYKSDDEHEFIPIRFIRGRFIYHKKEACFGDFSDVVTIVINLPTQSML